MSARRLLCCLPDLHGGGAERVMAYVCRGLDRSRFSVTLALGRRRGPNLPMIPPDVEVIELGADSGRAAVGPLVGLLRQRRFDVCLSMVQMNPAIMIARALARAPLPIVLSARNHYSRSLATEARFRSVKWLAVRALYPFADKLICVSEGVRDDLVERFGVPLDRTVVIHNPVEIDRIRELAREDPGDPWLAADATVPVAVAVGKLMDAKGYPDMLRAFRAIRSRTAARLLILGEGPLRADIERRLGSLGLVDDVRLLGFRDNPYAYVARATLMLHAALYEGFPNVLVEAMACGIPVVATDCPSGPSEIITDGRDGFLVAVGDADTLAERALALLGDAGLRRAVADAASRRVQEFAAPRVVARYAMVLEEAATS